MPRNRALRAVDPDELAPDLPEPEPEPFIVAAWAANLRQAFLLCRELGHTWRPLTASWSAPDEAFTRILRCTRSAPNADSMGTCPQLSL
jgi:hypothetical protein